ncbi:transcription factor GTE8-like isoform X2 [Coffea arabica]|uniref:Transcription factor GTE8-like n=2 Tax=Coffea arabica TaxID=13443 RepID=A0A6P6VJ47_COFAR|nr:transcription factor GTE8-like [Coffea arabica]XP_027101958.1 transcription factor GTE8-like [Coffea arabica]
MMARKERFPDVYSTGVLPNYESEGSGSSARLEAEITASEDSTAPRQKWVDVNSALRDGFDVPVQVVPLSKLSLSEKKSLILRLRSELEKIRVLQRKFQLLKTNAVTLSSSSDILSCSNVQRAAPPVLDSRKSSAQVSRSGKKSSSSGNKARGWNRGTSGRFESVKQGTISNSNVGMMKQCEVLLKKLMSHEYAWVFNTPVDIVKLNIPDYFTVIKQPMDLGTIKSKLGSGVYSSPLDLLADVKLTFSNAMTYNPPGNDVHIMADTMQKFFEARWKTLEKKLPGNSSQSVPHKSELQEEAEVVKPTAPSKKRKLSPLLHSVVQQPVKPRMTDEEKCNLSRELESLLGDLPDNIVDFLREQISNAGESGEDEIEIDIYDLSEDVLFTLRKLLDEYLKEKQKNDAKAEPCEIELPNESGLSSSSMQVDKGNDLVDEEVDIGGNEPPVSSYPAVEIERDGGLRSNRSNCKSDLGSTDHSDGEAEIKAYTATKPTLDESDSPRVLQEKEGGEDLTEGNQSVSGLDQLEQSSQEKPNSDESDSRQDGESAPARRPVSPEKLYRAALLKNRFADTILKAREKTLGQGEKGNPEKLRREREELELQKKREKARLQAEAKAAEDARRQAEEEAAAEARKKRELEREAARQALLQMEKTVEINENSRFLEDLEMLRSGPLEQLPSSVDETSPDHLQEGFGSCFKFGGNNPLEQLGLYMKVDEEDEEGEPPNALGSVNDDVEEGEID